MMIGTYLGSCAGAPSRFPRLPVLEFNHLLLVPQQLQVSIIGSHKPRNRGGALRAANSDGEGSYLDMWKKAVDMERKNIEFGRIVETSSGRDDDEGGEKPSMEELERKSREFEKILGVPTEERDRIQRMQVIDRAAAAIAAARAVLQESNVSDTAVGGELKRQGGEAIGESQQGMWSGITYLPESESQRKGIPGPDFWSWTPPPDSNDPSDDVRGLQAAKNPSVFSPNPIAEKERSLQFFTIPFESPLSQIKPSPNLPPFQSSVEDEKREASRSNVELPSLEEEQRRDALFADHAIEAANALNDVDKSSPSGVNPDGSRWWKETGIERRPDGVICKWTMNRGISADKATEWQETFWEASDVFGYKELGSEKSGRDAHGNVWREFWRESMRQENGLLHIEKTADKWGKNGKGEEWQENWWEHHGAGGQTEKWAHKWCSIDPNTPLEAGHAHVWHERWGETYDGKGGSVKYTDKWAERSVDGGWEKWGDKWDENFDLNAHGIKQGETWWEGKDGQRWNRTWGEQHNGSGWIHKYGRSSCGQHWDTHVLEDTWYERFPHYGFYHCFENSVQLREVPKPPDIQGV
ncbi:protein LIKE EARLY STARVATION, chloroplastic isoform X1 [Prosopis cineraria]|uniref:protein LIKE EARLY STARVATION, chloroplastic isoform X1 n=2 Tax=Prosopis cineraria TaxID=364024 RepID=UPI00240F8969|nr:protein LIKE EARLY STARVATION, chloroplastic isoform X1 [Prosopis cineraria]XP_054821078.1 protein LIKE EARLY STARVATION, chloroplastic isoform X1 [Prosopis cineraria]XP_054821079.1 protein LIKE EARLY STARVATION, chloroplastic isoform X1 [Prosopis cineraria]